MTEQTCPECGAAVEDGTFARHASLHIVRADDLIPEEDLEDE